MSSWWDYWHTGAKMETYGRDVVRTTRPGAHERDWISQRTTIPTPSVGGHNPFSLNPQIMAAAANQGEDRTPAWLSKEVFMPFPFLPSLLGWVCNENEDPDASTSATSSPDCWNHRFHVAVKAGRWSSLCAVGRWSFREKTDLTFTKKMTRGAPGWPSQLSVQLSISAQVTISYFLGWVPKMGSALTAWSLLGILSLSHSLSLPSLRAHALSLSLSLSLRKKH